MPSLITIAQKLTAAVWPAMFIGWTMVACSVRYAMHFKSPVIIAMSLLAAFCGFASLYRSTLYI